MKYISACAMFASAALFEVSKDRRTLAFSTEWVFYFTRVLRLEFTPHGLRRELMPLSIASRENSEEVSPVSSTRMVMSILTASDGVTL